MAERRPDRLAAILGHRFQRPELLAEALTHPSLAAPHGRGQGTYERLEFLGDRVLGLVIAHELITRFPDSDSGELARRYNALVRREALVRVAEDIGLGHHLSMAKAERGAGGHEKPAVLANACEAVIGALYLDGELEAAAAFVRRHWEAMIAALTCAPMDAKTRLQEWAQGLAKPPPTYNIVGREGPPHALFFTVEASVDGLAPKTATGRTIRAAEQLAAAAMLEALAEAGALGDG